jgi:hypothetical protein
MGLQPARDDVLIGEFGRSDGEESKKKVTRDKETKGIMWVIRSIRREAVGKAGAGVDASSWRHHVIDSEASACDSRSRLNGFQGDVAWPHLCIPSRISSSQNDSSIQMGAYGDDPNPTHQRLDLEKRICLGIPACSKLSARHIVFSGRIFQG